MESWTVANEREETETKVPNSQDAFLPRNYRRHKLDPVPSLSKTLLWEKTLKVMGKSLH